MPVYPGRNLRTAYFPTVGSAVGPAFDSYWQDTSAAVILPGVWDNPSGSPDAVLSFSGASPNKVLAAQYVFPAFGSMDFQVPWSGPYLSFGSSQFNAANCQASRVKTAGTGTLLVRAQAIYKVFRANGTLRYYMTLAPLVATGALPYSVLTGNNFGTNSYGALTLPDPTDYLVVELGFSVLNANYSYTVNFKLGDNYSLYVLAGATVMGNSGFTLLYWGPATLTSISAAAGQQGTSFPVTLFGTNFSPGPPTSGVVPAATVAVSGTGVTVSGVTAVPSSNWTQIMAIFTVAPGATLGPRDVTVTSGSITTAPVTFTVLPSSAVTTKVISPQPAGVGHKDVQQKRRLLKERGRSIVETSFLERHQDYVLKIASIAPGEVKTSVPLSLDTDAPFVLRSRAFRVQPTQVINTGIVNLQSGLQYLKTTFTGPDENYVSQQRIPATLHSYCFGNQGSPTPVFPQRVYPPGGVIYVDVENTGDAALTNVRLYFRGVKLYPWGSRPANTYRQGHGAIRPFCYPVIAKALPVTTTSPMVVPFIVEPYSDFVLRSGTAGTDGNQLGSNADYFEVEITLRDSEGKAFSNLPVHASVLFGRPSQGTLGYVGFGVSGESYPCGSLLNGLLAEFCGPSNPGLFYPEIYLQRSECMYLDFSRADSAFTNSAAIDFPVLLKGVKVLPS